LQTQSDQAHWKANIPELDNFPLVEMPSVEIDTDQLNALDWQRQFAKKFIQAYLGVNDWLQAQLDQARYFHIPVGNIPPNDPFLYASDIFFARHLSRSNHVLWISPTDRPDLGGKEEDNFRLVTEFDEGGSPEINQPGCYSTVCVEISIDSLAVNTVLQSHHVHDAEGVASSLDTIQQASLEEMLNSRSGAAATLTSYDEAASCAQSFKVLKGLIISWIQEVFANRNDFADTQLIHFYRYLRSPEAMLYDPALCKYIHGLMKKFFMQLIAEFKTLGSTIVYANFNKIILNSKKRRVKDALAYVQYILTSIRSKPLFKNIALEPRSCWEYLMWMDPANHGGIRAKEIPENFMSNVDDEEKEENGNEFDSDDEDIRDLVAHAKEQKVEMNWNLEKFLPTSAACQTFFKVCIADHIHSVYVHIVEQLQTHKGGSTPVKRRGLSTQQEMMAETTTTPSTVEFAQSRIQDVLTEQLFGITQKIHKTLSGGRGKDAGLEFPVLAGSHLPLKNPSLEFIKAVCQVLQLDVNIRNQVNKLRRDLLKLVGIGQFADEANFQDPCLSFIVPEMICEYCNSCRDLDLCRDPLITPAKGNQPASIRCDNPDCQQQYNMSLVEEQLVLMLSRRAMSYTLQDLKCLKCKMVKDKNMSKFCECAGRFGNLTSPDDFKKQLKIFGNIAKHYQMSHLQETLDFMNSSP